MGLLSRVHESRSYTVGPFSSKDPELSRLLGVGTRTLAGPVVTEFTAFMCDAVFDAVNQISSDIAKLPLNLMKLESNGSVNPFDDSRTHQLLKYAPNAEQDSMTFRQTVMVNALIAGNGYAEITRDEMGRPTALYNIEPHRVQAFRDKEMPGEPLRYRVDGAKVLRPRDVLHIKGIGWDGIIGFEMVQVARQAIGLAMASEQFAAAFFGNQARFGGILMSDQDLDPAQESDLRERVEAIHAKADKAFRLLVLGAGFKFQEMGVKPNEAQMKEIRDQQVMSIARFYNMPLHKLKLALPGAMSYASVSEMGLDYYTSNIQTWATRWEGELNFKLVPSLERGRQYFKHNERALLRTDFKTQSEALGHARDRGVISANEWRKHLDLNPQPGTQGDLYIAQSNQIPVSMLEEKIQAEIDKANQPPPAPAPAGGGGSGNGDNGERFEALARELADARSEASRLEAEKSSVLAQMEAQAASEAERERKIREDLERLITEKDQAAKEATERAAQADAVATAQSAEAARLAAVSEAAQAERDGAHEARIAAELAFEAEKQAAAAALEHERAQAELAKAEAEARAAAEVKLTYEQQARETAEQLADEREAAIQSAVQAHLEQTQRAAVLEAEIARLEAERTEAETSLVSLREVSEAATQRATEFETAFADIKRSADEAELEHHARLAALEAAQQALDAARQEAQAAADAASEALALAQTQVQSLTGEVVSERDARVASEAAARARVEETAAKLAEAEQAIAEAEARLREEREAQETAAQFASERAQEAAQALELRSRMEQAKAEQETAALAVLVMLEAEKQLRAEAEAALESERKAIRDHRLSVLTAMRGEIVHAMSRITRRETDRAKQKQATPQKLRHWLDGFAAVGEALAIEDLLPPMRTHLAWKRSTDDPVDITTALVREHLAAFTAQLRRVLESDPEDFHAELDRMLTRWETERPEQVADALLLEEIRHV